MSTFDAATTILRVKVASRGEGSERRELEAAIRVLEAAGGFTADDKVWLKYKVDWDIHEYEPRAAGMVCPGRAKKDRFNALLAALTYATETRKDRQSKEKGEGK